MADNKRETKTLNTPNGHEVVVYTEATGGEMRKIQQVFLRGVKASDLTAASSENADNSELLEHVDATTLMEAQELALEMLVVSVDGDEKKSVLDLKQPDADHVIKEIDNLTSGQTEGKKE